MSTSTLDQFEDFIRQKVEKDHTTHAQISEELKTMFPEKRGFSVRSVTRFCAYHNIHKTSRTSQDEMDATTSKPSETLPQLSWKKVLHPPVVKKSTERDRESWVSYNSGGTCRKKDT